MVTSLPLPGCSPTPLAHYLNALGVLRLLSGQLPSDAPRPLGSWQGETFVLHTTVDRAGLEQFFRQEYQPTPILAPWNGGSGFFEGDNQDGITTPTQPALRFAVSLLASPGERAWVKCRTDRPGGRSHHPPRPKPARPEPFAGHRLRP